MEILRPWLADVTTDFAVVVFSDRLSYDGA